MGSEKNKDKSTLKVLGGIEQPSSINEEALDRLKGFRRKVLSEREYLEGILSGNRTVLGQALTLVESSLDNHRVLAGALIRHCLPHSGNSVRIGITGVPGVGKSTFIETLGTYLTSSGKKVAVLAIDPSSERTSGSILGDKTRMSRLATDPNAFIRPSPSGGSLGGVAAKTRESVILCEASGYNVIIIETVGVGQSETSVHSMTDFFLLLMLAGAGDELQGIKRGIMEMADLIAINKADGSNLNMAGIAQAQYQNALQLFPASPSGWRPKVLTCSANSGKGITEIWQEIEDYCHHTSASYFRQKRLEQARYWMYEAINEQLNQNFYGSGKVSGMLRKLEKEVAENRMSPFCAARLLMDEYRRENKGV